jgi:hypothetical protein
VLVPSGKLILYLPAESVLVIIEVPLTFTCTPGRGDLFIPSVTIPVMVRGEIKDMIRRKINADEKIRIAFIGLFLIEMVPGNSFHNAIEIIYT